MESIIIGKSTFRRWKRSWARKDGAYWRPTTVDVSHLLDSHSRLESRLSLAEKVVEAAENVGPVLYAYLNEQDTGDHNVRALMYEVNAALAAYRSAK